MEVHNYHYGEWGTVCDDGWDLSDAKVVCNELGLGNAVAAKHNAFYGQGRDRLRLSDLNCTGDEFDIKSCSHSGWGVNTCNHSHDAGVKCTPGRCFIFN